MTSADLETVFDHPLTWVVILFLWGIIGVVLEELRK